MVVSDDDVRDCVSFCLICDQVETPKQLPTEELEPIPHWPWSYICKVMFISNIPTLQGHSHSHHSRSLFQDPCPGSPLGYPLGKRPLEIKLSIFSSIFFLNVLCQTDIQNLPGMVRFLHMAGDEYALNVMIPSPVQWVNRVTQLGD